MLFFSKEFIKIRFIFQYDELEKTIAEKKKNKPKGKGLEKINNKIDKLLGKDALDAGYNKPERI